jgi:hypothetical protein
VYLHSPKKIGSEMVVFDGKIRVENGLLDAGIRSILLNQTPSGINSKHYLKKFTQNDKSGQKRLELYDKFFPY